MIKIIPKLVSMTWTSSIGVWIHSLFGIIITNSQNWTNWTL